MADEKGQLTALPFDIITQSDIVSAGDLTALGEMAPELKENFLKVQVFRTRTEMEISVLNDLKHPTHADKYWQSVREMNVMFNELVMLSYEYRKNLVEIRQLQVKPIADEFEHELNKIEIEKKTFIARQQERTAKARIEELKNWSEIKAREAAQMTEKELADVDNHQLVSYARRFINQSLVAGDSGSPAEKQNLRGLLVTSLDRCEKRGLLDGIAAEYGELAPKILGQVRQLK